MSATGQQPPSGPAPGWYPDPWSPGAVRWWDGRGWTAFQAPVTAGQETDGLAVASLITSLSGLTPVGIVLGFVARRRIAREPHRRTGKGLATAGIICGFAGTALIALLIALAVNGVFDSENADDYSGTEQHIARTIDEFEAAWNENDGARLCAEVFTDDLATSYAGDCESEWSDDDGLADIDVESIQVIGDTANVRANDSGEIDWTFTMTRVDGDSWRICDLASD